MSQVQQSERVLQLIHGALRPNVPRGWVVMVRPRYGFDSELCVRAAAGIAHLLHGEVLGLGGALSDDDDPGALATLDTALAERFAEILREADTQGAWRSPARPAAAPQDFAHEADLIVCARDDDEAPGRRFDHVKRLLHTTGRPVFVPAGAAPPRFDHALVCWNDSPQARRAVADALPLLRRARSVQVLIVTEAIGQKQVEPRAREVERGLRARGVNAHAVVRAFGREGLADVVATAAAEEKIDYLVAGAYGRGAAWRAVTGSHTEALLAEVNRPVFLSR